MNVFDVMGYSTQKVYSKESKTSAYFFALIKSGVTTVNNAFFLIIGLR